MDVFIKIEFLSFWHTGSGLSGGVIADAMVHKTKEGFPLIPGKTIKGLLKDSAMVLKETNTGLVSDDFIETIFGSTDHHESTVTHFSNSYLSKGLREEILENKNLLPYLFQNIASTAIDEQGQAVDFSLREIEATVPLVLVSKITGFPEAPSFMEQLEYCCKYIKRIGTKRHRGFGRCNWSILKCESNA